MTYCAALRVNDVVHLIVDSAVTSSEIDAVPEEKETPFGEPYTPKDGRLTEDGAIKLFDIEGDAFALAGRVSSGISLLRHYQKYRRQDISKEASFELAVVNLIGFPSVTVIAALRDRERILVLKGTPKANPEIELIQDFVSIGANAEIRALFDARLLAVKDQWGDQVQPAACLALLTASGIATSVRHGTFRYGVGGAFNGVTVSADRLAWQQDHLIAVKRGDGPSDFTVASICNRNNWVMTRYKVAENPVGGKSIITPFGDEPSVKKADDLLREREAVRRASFYPIKTGKFSFASVIVQSSGHAHLVDMQRKRRHEFLEVTPPANFTGKFLYGVSIAPRLYQHLIDPGYADRTCFQINLPPVGKRQLTL